MAEQQEQSVQEQEFIQAAMQDPAVLERINALPPEERAEFVRKMFADYTGQSAINTEAMSQADALRSGGAPQGVTAGNQYVAASPLSHLARGMNQYTGNRDYNKAKADIAARSKDKSDALAQFADMQAGVGGSNEQPTVPTRQQMAQAEMLRRVGR